jgi:hypothetical protein
MNVLLSLALSTILGMLVVQPALAIRIENQFESSTPIRNATGIVERGGTVDVVDLRKKSLVVDGVTYVLPVNPISTHTLNGQVSANAQALKIGTQIRFNTSKNNYSAQEQVSEIWIVGQRKVFSGK